MRVQEKCFERWVGQKVWRNITHYASNRMLGLIMGNIVDIYQDKYGRTLYKVRWQGDIGEHTEYSQVREWIGNGYFDYGIVSRFELDVLTRGGLLGKDTAGVFDETQCKSLVVSLPFYAAALKYPDKPFITKEDIDV